MKTARWK